METSRFQRRGNGFFQGRDMGVDPRVNVVDPLPLFVPPGLLSHLAGLFLFTVRLFHSRGQEGQQTTPDILALDSAAIPDLAVVVEPPPS